MCVCVCVYVINLPRVTIYTKADWPSRIHELRITIRRPSQQCASAPVLLRLDGIDADGPIVLTARALLTTASSRLTISSYVTLSMTPVND